MTFAEIVKEPKSLRLKNQNLIVGKKGRILKNQTSIFSINCISYNSL